MTDILSPSPYAYLDDLPPAERQAEIARRQHSRREEWCDDARRARDYQAELAEANYRTEKAECHEDGHMAAISILTERANRLESQYESALSRIAELEAALEPFANLADAFDRSNEAKEEMEAMGLPSSIAIIDDNPTMKRFLYRCSAARAALRK